MLFFITKNNAEFEIACCFGILGIAFITGIVGFVISLVRRRQKNEGLIWANSARMLGLQLEPLNQAMLSDIDKIRNRFGANIQMQGNTTAQAMFGQYAGCEVRVWIRQEKYMNPGIKAPIIIFHTCCLAKFSNRRGLRFLISRKNAFSSLISSIAGGQVFQIGYEPFDRLYQIEGNEPIQIRSVLAHRASDLKVVAQRFAEFSGSNWSIGANETQVFAETKGMVIGAHRISDGLSLVADIANRFGKALE